MRFNLDKPFRTKIDGAILLGKTIIDQPMGSEQKKKLLLLDCSTKDNPAFIQGNQQSYRASIFSNFYRCQGFLLSGF